MSRCSAISDRAWPATGTRTVRNALDITVVELTGTRLLLEWSKKRRSRRRRLHELFFLMLTNASRCLKATRVGGRVGEFLQDSGVGGNVENVSQQVLMQGVLRK